MRLVRRGGYQPPGRRSPTLTIMPGERAPGTDIVPFNVHRCRPTFRAVNNRPYGRNGGRLIIAPTGAEEDGGRLIIAPTGAVDGFGCVTGVGAVVNRPRSEEFR